MLSDEEIERAALLLRRLLAIEERYCPDMIFVLDELKRHRKIERYFILNDERVADEAFYDSNEHAIIFGEVFSRSSIIHAGHRVESIAEPGLPSRTK
jgi:hypothetical protein